MTTPASPSPAEAEAKDTFEQKVAELRASGILVSGGQGSIADLRPVAYVPGALARFLEKRNNS